MSRNLPNNGPTLNSPQGLINGEELLKALKSGGKWSVLTSVLTTCAAGALLAVLENFDKIYTGPAAAAIGAFAGMLVFPLRSWYLGRKLLDEGEEP